MGDIAVTMSRAAYNYYMNKEKGGFKSKDDLIAYLNSSGGYRGHVTEIHVEANAPRKPRAKDEE